MVSLISLAHIRNIALEEMKRRLNTACFHAAAGGGREVVGNRHLSICFLHSSVPQKCQPQKPDLRTSGTLLVPQEYSSLSSGNNTLVEPRTWRYGAKGHSSCHSGLEAGSGLWGLSGVRGRVTPCPCARLNLSFQTFQNLAIHLSVLHNVLVLFKGSEFACSPEQNLSSYSVHSQPEDFLWQ